MNGGRKSAVDGPKPEGHGAVSLHPVEHEGGDGGRDDTGSAHCANAEQSLNPKAVQDILMAGAAPIKGEKRAIDYAANSADPVAGGSAAGHDDRGGDGSDGHLGARVLPPKQGGMLAKFSGGLLQGPQEGATKEAPKRARSAQRAETAENTPPKPSVWWG